MAIWQAVKPYLTGGSVFYVAINAFGAKTELALADPLGEGQFFCISIKPIFGNGKSFGGLSNIKQSVILWGVFTGGSTEQSQSTEKGGLQTI